jgi:hypothetical protein
MCFLFSNVPSNFDDWKILSDDDRRKKYSPVKVRLAIENARLPVPISHWRYGQLCEKATHPSPRVPPGMYNHHQRPCAGGYFQLAGLCFCLYEVAWPIHIISLLAPSLLRILSDDHIHQIVNAAQALHAAFPDLQARVNAEFPNTYPKLAEPQQSSA